MKATSLLLFLLHAVLVLSKWPLKRNVTVPGDLLIAGFFPVHEIDHKLECGKLEEEGFYQLETFLYIVREINDNPNILPDIKLGAIALDTCDSDSHTLEVGMDLVKGFFARSNPYVKSEEQITCNDGSFPRYHGHMDKVIAAIGGRSSRVSVEIANLLRIYAVPQVSYKSNAPELSDKNKYEYFFRTVAPIKHQVKAVVEVLKAYNWTYVSVVYSDSTYGNTGFGSFLTFTQEASICFASQQRINIKIAKDEDYESVLNNLLNARAKAVVLFGEQLLAREVMSAATKRGVLNNFIWLGSEAWGSRSYATLDNERVAEGAITAGYMINPPRGFIDHFKSLEPSTSAARNPWFYEFWESKLRCRLPGFEETPYNKNFTKWCKSEDKIPDKSYMEKMPSSQLVRDAVYAIAHALHDMHNKKCKGQRGLCDAMKNIEGKELRKYLRKVEFLDMNDYKFKFDKNGDAYPIYYIINFQKMEDSDEYGWQPVGTYIVDVNGVLSFQLRKEAMRFKHDIHNFPDSVCSAPCLPGQIKILHKDISCCWSCFNCSDYQYLDRFYGRCKNCPQGTLPTSDKTRCDNIPVTYMFYGDSWAIGAISFSVIGLVITIFVSAVFCKYWATPIVKASGRDLSAVLLLSIFLSFGMTFVIISKPSPGSCSVVRLFLGLCYSLSYAAILTKTRRIACIFDMSLKSQNKKLNYTSPQSQLMITFILTSIEGIINAIWLMYDPPSTAYHYPTREEKILICKGSNTIFYLIGLIYPFSLMIACTVYAFKTRKCPDGFNEARHITFANCTICVIWIAFLPMYMLNNSSRVRSVTLSLLLSLSAAVHLLCLFFPKVYIAIIKSEQNTKDIVMGYRGRYTSSTGTPN